MGAFQATSHSPGPAFKLTKPPLGQSGVNTGGCKSNTVTVNVTTVKPEVAVTVVVLPAGKNEPEGGTTVTVPQPLEAPTLKNRGNRQISGWKRLESLLGLALR